jgi:hypothetical protein
MQHEAGHKKPPAHTRYQTGRSDNPGGRPGPRRDMERRFGEGRQTQAHRQAQSHESQGFLAICEAQVLRSAFAKASADRQAQDEESQGISTLREAHGALRKVQDLLRDGHREAVRNILRQTPSEAATGAHSQGISTEAISRFSRIDIGLPVLRDFHANCVNNTERTARRSRRNSRSELSGRRHCNDRKFQN